LYFALREGRPLERRLRRHLRLQQSHQTKTGEFDRLKINILAQLKTGQESKDMVVTFDLEENNHGINFLLMSSSISMSSCDWCAIWNEDTTTYVSWCGPI